jgi:hypothetical protein
VKSAAQRLRSLVNKCPFLSAERVPTVKDVTMEMVEKIKQLAADGYGDFLPSYMTLRNRYVGIRSSDPDRCATEASVRGIGNVNIYLCGSRSVVCWPSLPAI